MIYRVELGEDETGTMSIAVTNYLQERWGVSTDELHRIAVENMLRLYPSTFKSSMQALDELMQNKEANAPEDRTSGLNCPEGGPAFILCNVARKNGAAAILDKDLMHKIVKKFHGEFYVLPSSIHELIFIPKLPGIEVPELKEMVLEVNTNEVAEHEILSYRVYRYDAETSELVCVD